MNKRVDRFDDTRQGNTVQLFISNSTTLDNGGRMFIMLLEVRVQSILIWPIALNNRL